MENAQLLSVLYDAIEYFRVQNYSYGINIFNEKILKEINRLVDNDYEEDFTSIIKMMIVSLEKQDYILLADILEDAIIPIIKNRNVVEKEFVVGDYQVEVTSSGAFTIKCISKDMYLHSNVNPIEEAKRLVKMVYNPDVNEYAVWGLGLGYHIKELYKLSHNSVIINVYEEDDELIDIVINNGYLNDIEKNGIQIQHDPDGSLFANKISEDCGILMHLPSIKKIKRDGVRENLLRFFLNWNSFIHFKKDLSINFRKNVLNCNKNVDELKEEFAGKEVIIVGAGPSLDDSIDYLRDNCENRIVIAVSAVYKKLKEERIKADYVVVMDPSERSLMDVMGMRSLNEKLIVDSTAYWEYGDKFNGDKYILYQKGYPQAERVADTEGWKLYDTGGSVVTIAIEIAIKFCVSSIYLVGVDLAYVNGASHVSGTKDAYVKDLCGLQRIKNNIGGVTYTTNSFINVINWIERRINDNSGLKVYNLSKNGAYIKGTILFE